MIALVPDEAYMGFSKSSNRWNIKNLSFNNIIKIPYFGCCFWRHQKNVSEMILPQNSD